jgi:CheY-like chemotaxis protein
VAHAAPRVLIAEDHDINQMLIVALAEAAGLAPIIAADGQQAVDMVRAAAVDGRPFAMVLMDMQMPVVDGLDATRQLRALGFTAEMLPIIALTANAYPEDRKACLAAGMQAHLGKPVRLRDLQDMAARFIDGKTEAEEPVEVVSGPKPVAQRYRERRSETLDAVSACLRRGDCDGASLTELVSMLHKLAGTAGFFGETRLGEVASTLERALHDALPERRLAVLEDGWQSLCDAA